MMLNRYGNYVLRGQAVEADGPKEINLFSGSYTGGFRLVNFQVASFSYFTSEEVQGVIKTNGQAFANLWNWSEPTEIGWAATNMVAGGTRDTTFSLVDSSRIVVDKIFVNVNNNKGGTDLVNYYIEMMPVDLKSFEYALAYVQGIGQG